LFGKLICWGEDRDSARRRALRALGEMRVEGIPTTASFHTWALQTPEFIAGTHTTGFVETALAEGRFEPPAVPTPTATGGAPVGGHDGSPFNISVEVDGHRIPVLLWGVELPHAPRPPASASSLAGGDADTITAPMQGTILQVMVEPGQAIGQGDIVCILEAMKMENHIGASRDGVVREVTVAKGDVVQSGAVLVSFE
jgi:acetyl-CoA/propionyl-CoA carboxylase biotin carboxyl carrier protein